MNFIIQKLKNKQIFLKKLSNWAKLNSLILREREETITKYFAPWLLRRPPRAQILTLVTSIESQILAEDTSFHMKYCLRTKMKIWKL